MPAQGEQAMPLISASWTFFCVSSVGHAYFWLVYHMRSRLLYRSVPYISQAANGQPYVSWSDRGLVVILCLQNSFGRLSLGHCVWTVLGCVLCPQTKYSTSRGSCAKQTFVLQL